MQLHLLVLVLAVISYSVADISILEPKTGQTYSGSSGTVSINIIWEDDAEEDTDGFSLAKINTYVISLCTGTDSNIHCFSTIQSATPMKDSISYIAEFSSLVCENGFYFFQIYTTFPDDEHTIHYSNRFELTAMKGNSQTLTAPFTVTGPPPPAQTEQNDVENNEVDSRSFTIYYTSQTGSWRYAPMQMQPGTTPITKTEWARRFPTSSVTYFTTIRKNPLVLSTKTPGWSYTIQSVHNWASVAPYPTVAYSAKARVTSASLNPAIKKRRWLD